MKPEIQEKAFAVASRLVNQEKAQILIPAMGSEQGFWFGGGNTIQDREGNYWICGRYRNSGDSRYGLQAGERGAELAIFSVKNNFKTIEKVLSFTKADLGIAGKEVLSIEGAKLHITNSGVELFVSTEKKMAYPEDIKEFQKPGTGIWSIERMAAPNIEDLPKSEIRTLIAGPSPEYMHIKDPVVYDTKEGDTVLAFCLHPFNWSSSNSGYIVRPKNSEMFSEPNFNFFRRGDVWDVAISRITSIVPLPARGPFAENPFSLFFYDGGECLRNLDEHKAAVKRPRGYSCEELGGLALIKNDDLSTVERVSKLFPAFVSPYGTGSSRYVDVYDDGESYIVTWEQSQKDKSQPLVVNLVSHEEINRILDS